MVTNDPAAIAAMLTDVERLVCKALCGNAWDGYDETPGIRLVRDLGFMHVTPLGSRFKAYPTSLGLAVRDHLLKEQANGQ